MNSQIAFSLWLETNKPTAILLDFVAQRYRIRPSVLLGIPPNLKIDYMVAMTGAVHENETTTDTLRKADT